MKKKFLILSLAFIAIYYSCINNGKANNNNPKTVTLIFDFIKSNYDTLYFENGGNAYTTAPVFFVKLSPNKSENLLLKDTVEIELITNFAVITHKYAPLSSIDFILEAGDTAHIKYVNEIPFIDVSNRKILKCDLNYDSYKRQRYGLIEDMQLHEIMNNPSFYVYKRIMKGDKSVNVPNVLTEFYPKLIHELNDENLWLDSLFQSNQISEREFHFFKERNKYTTLNLKLGEKTQTQLETDFTEYNDATYKNDLFGFYNHYYYMLGIKYLNNMFSSKEIKSMTEAYDYFENHQNIKGKLSQDLLELALRNIMKNSPVNLRHKYFQKFANTVSDTAVTNKLTKEFENLLDSTIAIKSDVSLLSANGEKSTLTAVINQCKGKLVYLDFWASWCAPCIEEMSFSKQLRENEAYKDVVFIYLALNDNKDKWENVLDKVHLKNHPYNYLILNSKEALFVEQFKINTLPRYMIFDKDGKLYNADAPRPSDSTIHNVLTGK